MSTKPAKCIRCHPPNPGDTPLSGPAHFICDRCMEDVNHPFVDWYERMLAKSPCPPSATSPAAPPEADGRKSSKKRGRKTKAVATALVLMLLPFVGCTVHRTTALDVVFSPGDVLSVEPQETAVEIPTPRN